MVVVPKMMSEPRLDELDHFVNRDVVARREQRIDGSLIVVAAARFAEALDIAASGLAHGPALRIDRNADGKHHVCTNVIEHVEGAR